MAKQADEILKLIQMARTVLLELPPLLSRIDGSNPEKKISSFRILELRDFIAHYFGVQISVFISKRRQAELAWQRQVAMFLIRELTEATLAQIGAALGGRDHGTVLYGCQEICGRCQVYHDEQEVVNQLRGILLERFGRTEDRGQKSEGRSRRAEAA